MHNVTKTNQRGQRKKATWRFSLQRRQRRSLTDDRTADGRPDADGRHTASTALSRRTASHRSGANIAPRRRSCPKATHRCWTTLTTTTFRNDTGDNGDDVLATARYGGGQRTSRTTPPRTAHSHEADELFRRSRPSALHEMIFLVHTSQEHDERITQVGHPLLNQNSIQAYDH